MSAAPHSREDVEEIRRLIAVDEAEAKPHLADRLKIQKAWLATVDARDAEIGRWRALHENAEWKGAAYLEALREAKLDLESFAVDFCGAHPCKYNEDCQAKFAHRGIAKIEAALAVKP